MRSVTAVLRTCAALACLAHQGRGLIPYLLCRVIPCLVLTLYSCWFSLPLVKGLPGAAQLGKATLLLVS